MTTDIVDVQRPSRRTFLKGAGTAAALALTIGFEWAGTSRRAIAAETPGATFAPNAFLRVGADDSVTVIAKQGVTADSMTKAVMLMSREKAMELVERTPGAAAYIAIAGNDDKVETTQSKRFADFSK